MLNCDAWDIFGDREHVVGGRASGMRFVTELHNEEWRKVKIPRAKWAIVKQPFDHCNLEFGT